MSVLKICNYTFAACLQRIITRALSAVRVSMLPRALNSCMQRTPSAHARQQQGRSRSRAVAVRASNEGWAWGNKAASRDRRPENVAGDFYVDHTCIGG